MLAQSHSFPEEPTGTTKNEKDLSHLIDPSISSNINLLKLNGKYEDSNNNNLPNHVVASFENLISSASLTFTSRIMRDYNDVTESLKNDMFHIISKEIKNTYQKNEDYEKNIKCLQDVCSGYEQVTKQQQDKIAELTAELEEKKLTFRLNQEMSNSKRFIARRYSDLKIKQKAYFAWKKILERSWRERIMMRLYQEADLRCAEQSKNYEQKIEKLNLELMQAYEELNEVRACQENTLSEVKSALDKNFRCYSASRSARTFSGSIPEQNEEKKNHVNHINENSLNRDLGSLNNQENDYDLKNNHIPHLNLYKEDDFKPRKCIPEYSEFSFIDDMNELNSNTKMKKTLLPTTVLSYPKSTVNKPQRVHFGNSLTKKDLAIESKVIVHRHNRHS